MKIWLFIFGVVGMGACHAYSLAGTVYTCTDQEGRVIYTDSPAQLDPCHLFAFEWVGDVREASKNSWSYRKASAEHDHASDPWRSPGEIVTGDDPTSDDSDPVPPEFPPALKK